MELKSGKTDKTLMPINMGSYNFKTPTQSHRCLYRNEDNPETCTPGDSKGDSFKFPSISVQQIFTRNNITPQPLMFLKEPPQPLIE